MGVGGKFWDALKPYGTNEGFDYLRDKKVAVDLSFWIVQHETAIKAKHARNPHLRLTFFRTINLFSKFGVYPVFVVDGNPSPLKTQARQARFLRFSGVDLSSSSVAEEGVSVDRNPAFRKCVRECVELIELLGMPVLKAKSEAEALCAQLNRDGFVDACITADSDAFLFGAKCVIKSIDPNSREPLECYQASDIEAGLGLKKNHLIAISLLVGSDHDLNGVQGIGLDTALRFVRSYREDEILNSLHKIANGDMSFSGVAIKSLDDSISCSDESPVKAKSSHCSLCGHPGSKKEHLKFSCAYCKTSDGEGCTRKPLGFKCVCSSCELNRKEKEQQKLENWTMKVCTKIATEQNFPNDEIIDLYLCDNHGDFTEEDGPILSWGTPKTELLIDFLGFYQNWQPSYIRQRMLPMMSTIFLRQISRTLEKTLLCGQYEFDSIQRIKIRYGHQYYVVKWKKATRTGKSIIHGDPVEESDVQLDEYVEVDDDVEMLDESDIPKVQVDEGFLLTDENMDLVQAAFPEKVDAFLQAKEMKEMKKKSSSSRLESSKPKGVQSNITDFYRATKSQTEANEGEDSSKRVNTLEQGTPKSEEKRKRSSSSLPKSVRRRLLFE